MNHLLPGSDQWVSHPLIRRTTMSRTLIPTHQPKIRRLSHHDEADLRDLLLGLDAQSRASRFSGTMKEASLIQYSRSAVSSATLIAGAYIDDRLRGVVEIYDSPCGGFSEAAFVVHQDWRRQGIGFELLQVAQQWCKNRDDLRCGWSLKDTICQCENWRTRRPHK